MRIVACLLMTGMAGLSVYAQEEKPVNTYTRVALWQVPRTKWTDFVDYFAKYDKPVMDQLFKDGVITEWGIDSNTIHTADGYTHSTWFSATSMEKLESVWDAYDAYMKKLGDKESKAADAKFASMVTKHRDYMLKTEGMRAKATALTKNGYWKAAYFRIKSGEWQDFESYYSARVKPVYEALMTQGTIIAYGVTGEAIVTEEPNGVTIWYITPDAAGLDKADAAFDEDWGKIEKEDRRARRASIQTFYEEGSVREFLTKMEHYQIADM